MFHFSSGADTSQLEKDVKESTEGKQGENMCHESLYHGSVGVKSLDENEDTSTDHEYWNIPREIEESSASKEECTALPLPCVFKKHEKSARPEKLEPKLSSNEASVYDQIIVRTH